MSYKPEDKHLTVLGFAGQKSNSASAKAGKAKLRKAKEGIGVAAKNVSSVISKTFDDFKIEFENDPEGYNKAVDNFMENLKKQ